MLEITDFAGKTYQIFPGAKLYRARILRQDLRNADLSGCIFEDCFFNETDLTNADLTNSSFTGCSFFKTNLSGADLRNSHVSDCYWNKTIHSTSTKWPVEFSPIDETKRDDEVLPSKVGFVWHSLLASPGLVKSDELSHFVVKKEHFLDPEIKLEFISASYSKALITRLAFHLFLANKHERLDATEYYTNFFFSEILNDVDSVEDDQIDELIFSTYVLLLLFLGLRFQAVLGDGKFLVSFEPFESMQTFAESDVFKVFRYAVEHERMLRGEDDLIQSIDEISRLSPVVQCQFKFRVANEEKSTGHAINELIEDFLFSAEHTETNILDDEESEDFIELVEDDEFADEFDHELDDEAPIADSSDALPDDSLYVRMLGIQSIEKAGHNRYSALLVPDLDYRKFSEEFKDDQDDELPFLGVPTLGIFDSFFPI